MTFFGYGFIITDPSMIKDESYFSNKWRFPINQQYDFFGLPLKYLNEPGYFTIPIKDEFDLGDFRDMITDYKHYFPFCSTSTIKRIVINKEK